MPLKTFFLNKNRLGAFVHQANLRQIKDRTSVPAFFAVQIDQGRWFVPTKPLEIQKQDPYSLASCTPVFVF